MSSRNAHEKLLNSLGSRPTLGEITRFLSRSSGLWQEADARFGGRIDYRLWRVFHSDSSAAYSTTVNCDDILVQLEKGKPEVVWGLIVLLHHFLIARERELSFLIKNGAICSKLADFSL